MMSRVNWIASISIGITTLAVVVSYSIHGLELWSPLFTILGIVWLVGFHRRWRQITWMVFTAFVVSTAFLAWKGTLPGIMLISLGAALVAWDLDFLIARFENMKPGSVDPEIERQHLKRLAAIIGIGFSLGGVALAFRIRFSFGLALLLVLLAFIGLSQLILNLRKSIE
jgi:hypothetical protein